jgi:hypothetical protein
LATLAAAAPATIAPAAWINSRRELDICAIS